MYAIKGFSTKKDIKKQFSDNNVPLTGAFTFVGARVKHDSLNNLELENKQGEKQVINKKDK